MRGARPPRLGCSAGCLFICEGMPIDDLALIDPKDKPEDRLRDAVHETERNHDKFGASVDVVERFETVVLPAPLQPITHNFDVLLGHRPRSIPPRRWCAKKQRRPGSRTGRRCVPCGAPQGLLGCSAVLETPSLRDDGAARADRSRDFVAAYPQMGSLRDRRSLSTFSCDIAYSDRPTASSASRRPW